MPMGWREKDGMAQVALADLLPASRIAPPAIEGVILADPGEEYIALWFTSASRVVSRAKVIAWRVSGPQAWPVTLLPVEPPFLKRPDGVVFDISTGERWDNEGDWMVAQP